MTTKQKPIKHSVAIVVRDNKGQFLAIQRSEDDESLPGAWGLPAGTLQPGESDHEAAIRVGQQKLGIEIAIKRKIGRGSLERETYTLDLADYEVEIVKGEPYVPQSDTTISQYIDLKYTNDLNVLAPAARAGSLCSRVFLDAQRFAW